uniref:TPR_REGION domain-containing protein n=1 Tax=Parastrongyloides trichosuri TaxID=131310 RepID=A0A0N4ZQ76_PARTI
MGKIRLFMFIVLLLSINCFVNCNNKKKKDSDESKEKEKQPVLLLSETFIAEHRSTKESPSLYDITTEDITNEGTGKKHESVYLKIYEVNPIYKELSVENVTFPNVNEEELKEGEECYREAVSILTGTEFVEWYERRSAYDLLVKAASLKHPDAMKVVAYGDMMGHFNEAQIHLDYLQELAKYGSPDANMLLGFIYSTGLGNTIRDPRKAFVYYNVAALYSNTLAQMALGYRYLHGINVDKSCDISLEYYKQVAEKVVSSLKITGGQSITKYKLLDELDTSQSQSSLSGPIDKNLLEYYILMADKGDTQACIGLGALYLNGARGVNPSYENAFRYYTIAANEGSGTALGYLGKMYLEGTRVTPQNNLTAFNYFKKSAEKGSPVGQTGLGYMYLFGRGVEVNYTKAFKSFYLATEQTHAEGQLYVGYMYFKGLGVKRDFALAMKYLQAAAQGGSISAFYWLGHMYAKGLGVFSSCDTAVGFYKTVAERGKWGVPFMQAYTNYKKGKYRDALLQYLLFADIGYEIAQSNFAYILDRTNEHIEFFNETNIKEIAFTFWKRSAEQNNPIARIKVGDYLYYGIGTDKDHKQAAEQYKLAADKFANSQALFNLGYMYEHGLGLPKDLHLAKRLYDQAIEMNPEAFVPVTIALLKLKLLFLMESFDLYDYNDFLPTIYTEDFNKILIPIFTFIVVSITILRTAVGVLRRRANMNVLEGNFNVNEGNINFN